MTCSEYEVLLNKLLEGKLSEDERDAMCLHEQDCANCRAMRETLCALQDDLASLGDAPVPVMPEGLHQRWMEQVKEDAMQNTEQNEENRKKESRILRVKPRTKRLLAWAAALVFVVGGTLLSRDSLPARSTKSTMAGKRVVTTQVVSDDYAYEMPMMATAASYDADFYEYEYEVEEDAEIAVEGAADAGIEASRPSKIIRNVSLTLTTRQFDEVLSGIKAACDEAGGRVTWESMSLSGSLRRVNMTLRIPSEQLDAFLGGTEGLARVTSREETANDLTDSYYDTASRLETQRQLLERLRALMTETASLSELLQLESQIADTQYTIDRLQGSLNSTDSKVAESTVNLTLREEKEAEVVVNQEASFTERVGSALKAGFHAFADFVEDMAVFVVAALPFIGIAALVFIIFVVIRRKKK